MGDVDFAAIDRAIARSSAPLKLPSIDSLLQHECMKDEIHYAHLQSHKHGACRSERLAKQHDKAIATLITP